MLTPLLLAASSVAMEVDEVVTVEYRSLEENLAWDQAALGAELVVIDRDQFESIGEGDINTLLNQFVPGLFAVGARGRYDAGYASLQGSRKQDILWLIDGNRINNRLYGGIYLDSLNPNIIERIEVLKGGQGVVFGTEAIAGVINIVTRNYQGETEGTVSVGGDTLETASGSLFYTTAVDALKWSVFGSATTSEGFQLWRDEDIHWTAAGDKKRGYTVANAGTKLRWVISDASQLTVLAQYNHGDLERLRTYGTIDSNNERREQIYTAEYQYLASDQLQLLLKGYYHGWDSYYTRIDQDEAGKVTVVDDNSYWGFEDYGLKLSAKLTQDNGDSWLMGTEFQSYRGEDEVMEFVSDTEVVRSLFAQYRPQFKALADTSMAVGLRYSDIESAGDSLNWSLGGEHRVNAHWLLRASAGTGFRLPSAEELYSVEREGGLIGNPNLDPEQSLNLNLGLSWQQDAWLLEPTLFWRRVDDLIGVKGNKYDNLDNQVETQGAELNLAWQGSDLWHWQGHVTYADSREKGSSEQIEEVPKWLASTRLEHTPIDALSLYLFVSYTGEFTDYATDAGDYWLLELGGSYRWGQHHTLKLRLENALDEEYAAAVFNPGKSVPDSEQSPKQTLGIPRNLQLNYQYQF
ncbi:TonB-dependent receptor plug domain-containing protein [Ferrimonas kyonanensis]|uniref:TonB-dependent receptor plug domain-containing protein n=1 Tax=Ferrimonas kyonanensis TaxID=364763 RepID=UPI0004107501|nr:TonB-dependent receptor [Ferrimonas kyonanensis]